MFVGTELYTIKTTIYLRFSQRNYAAAQAANVQSYATGANVGFMRTRSRVYLTPGLSVSQTFGRQDKTLRTPC